MYMRLEKIIEIFEKCAPKWTAWEKDNVGLQVGDKNRDIRKVLVTLDVNEKVIEEAKRIGVDLIISHHPILYRMPSSITTDDSVGNLILQLVENKIALFSAHTNLDFAKCGVSVQLARVLNLQDIRFLLPLDKTLAKIVVFVPENYVDVVMNEMSTAGAGVIGEYSSCSFKVKGIGSFRGSDATNPFIGKSGVLEYVDEVRLEMIAPRAKVESILKAMKAVHPYEEVAYDVYYVENPNPNFGIGAIGNLQKSQELGAFLKFVKRKLGCKSLRYTGNIHDKVKKVAVAGGGCSNFLQNAIKERADVFITADIKYHTFQDAEGKIALVDAGHWETEVVILKQIVSILENASKTMDEKLLVRVTKTNTNPIKIIN